MSRFEVVALPTAVRVAAGDDLVAILLDAAAAAGTSLRDGDVVCVASKVVSKAEGAVVSLTPGTDPHAARRELAIAESFRVVAETPWVLVVETRHGFVCANAGIDTSNVTDGHALLLPNDPDGSARALRDGLRARTGAEVGVVVTDTFGRPWRMGQTDVALGAAGIVALRDDRGSPDLEGRALEVTMIAVADQLAAAADLARRKADGAAFVLVRGLEVAGEGSGRDLVRSADEDVFRYGGPTAVERAVSWPGEPLPLEVQGEPPRLHVPSVAERALRACRTPGQGPPTGAVDGASGWMAGDVTDRALPGLPAADVRIAFWFRGGRLRLLDVGGAVERVRLVLQAHGLGVEVVHGEDLGPPPRPPAPVHDEVGDPVDPDALQAGLEPLLVVLGTRRPATSAGRGPARSQPS